MVTYSCERGRRVQGPRRLDAAKPARRAVSRRWSDPQRTRTALADDPLRRDEALARAGSGRSGGHAAARAREAALPEPRPDPADPRPLGQPVRRALGRRPQRAQDPNGGKTVVT